MNTFRRYLLSYLTLLLLPIVILSFFIFQIVLQYCNTQILDRNKGALQQLQTAVSIQLDQLDATTSLTTRRTEFFEKKLRSTGAFYNTQRTLTQWRFTNTFVDDIYFYNTAVGRVYAYDSIYTPEAFYTQRLAPAGIPSQAFPALIQGQGSSRSWLSTQPQNGAAGKIVYASAVRVSSKSSNVMIYEISQSTLRSLISNAGAYPPPECLTLICTQDGLPLYADVSTQEGDIPLEEIIRLAMEATDERVLIGRTPMFCTKLTDAIDGLLYISLIPQSVASAPVSRMRTMFFIGLLLILALGGFFITLVMHINYKPISELESAVMDAKLVATPSKDAVANLRSALNVMQQKTLSIAGQVESGNKERLVLRLLVGCYQTPEDFNHDGAPLSMQLRGDAWRIVLVCVQSQTESEDFAALLVDTIRRIFAGSPSPLFLEIPENHSFVFVAGDAHCPDGPSIAERLAAQEIRAQVLVSPVCASPAEFARLYAHLLRQIAASPDEPASSCMARPPKELFTLLYNAFEFGEIERIAFALNALIETIDSAPDTPDVLTFAYDALHIAQQYWSAHGDEENANAVQLLKVRLFSEAITPREAAGSALRALAQLPAAAETPASEDENVLLKDILEFLSDAYKNVDFTVQSVAEQFDLSISNLSHYFKKHVGLSVSSYVESLRIEAAKELLLRTDMNIADIAHASGYAQPATFMRAFKKVCGQSPTSFRNAAE